MQYHQRNRASRSSSEWDRVVHLHYNHQAIKPHNIKEKDPNKAYFLSFEVSDFYFHDGHDQADRTISTS